MLRLIFASLLSLFFFSFAYSQGAEPKRMSAAEKEIRALDLAEAKAFKEKDEKAIERFFAGDAVVNNPRNTLTFGREGVVAVMRTPLNEYSSFERTIESVRIHEKTAIVMGSESVVLKNPGSGSGAVVRRRYTNVWMKSGKTWQIVARHANVICQ